MDKLTNLIDLWLSATSHLGDDSYAIIEDKAQGQRACSHHQIEPWVQSTCNKLNALGVGPNTPVFVAMTHSIEAVILIVSLWRLGAVYIPLERAQDNASNNITNIIPFFEERPSQVLCFVNELNSDYWLPIADFHLVETQLSCLDQASSVQVRSNFSSTHPMAAFNSSRLSHLDFNKQWDCRPKRKRRRLASSNKEGSSGIGGEVNPGVGIANIFHSSGSTGRPKRVVISRDNLATRIDTLTEGGQAHTQLWFAPLNFDASLNELIECLFNFGCFLIVSNGVKQDASKLVNCIGKHKVSRIITTPQLLAGMDTKDSRLRSLKKVTSMGESPTQWGLQMQSDIPGSVLANEYGPTENTIQSTSNGMKLSAANPNDIGSLVNQVHGLVLKPDSEQADCYVKCSPGEKGELFLSGKQLSPGYLSSTATIQSFVYLRQINSRVFEKVSAPGGGALRWYQTQDFVSVSKRKRFTFLGRANTLLKIKGRRYSLNELKRGIASLEEVEDLHVAVLKKSSGDGVGVCVFVVAAESLVKKDTLDSNGLCLCINRSAENRLRQLCRLKGVDIKCLNRYFFLKELPLSSRGKVDSLKLVQDAKQCVLSKKGAAIRSEIKPLFIELIKKVEELVGCSVNLDEDLMSLGLDSLDMIQLHQRVRGYFPGISLRHFVDAFSRRDGPGMTLAKLFVFLEKLTVDLDASPVRRSLLDSNILFRPLSGLDEIIRSVHRQGRLKFRF